MNKKGFTLIELLGVVTLLALIAVIITPVVEKTVRDSKVELYNSQISIIELSAKNWASENPAELPIDEGTSINITLGDLIDGDFIEDKVTNPITKDEFPRSLSIKITKVSKIYKYDVLDDTKLD